MGITGHYQKSLLINIKKMLTHYTTVHIALLILAFVCDVESVTAVTVY